MYTIAVDIGGTFTDVVAIDGASGHSAIGKVLTTPDDLLDGAPWPFLRIDRTPG
ncbi:MAG: hydantoinase/oxoprolinase N-terminal domain-containing protein [Alphaproteobacteria bacterium]